MIAGDDARGGFKAKQISHRYEHRLCLAQRALSADFYESIAPPVPPAGPVPPLFICEVFCHKGDASQFEALEKRKVHVASVRAACIHVAASLGEPSSHPIDVSVKSSFGIADILKMDENTGKYVYRLMEREFRSVGAPTWLDRSNNSHLFQGKTVRLSVFLLGRDRGPDNVGSSKLIKEALKGVMNVCVASSWCQLHGMHLNAGNHLDLLAWWDWEGADPNDVTDRLYTSELASISNAWRLYGGAEKLRRFILDEKNGFGPDYLQRVSRVPGRVLESRWGSVFAVEELINRAIDCLGPWTTDLCDAVKASERKGKAKAKPPGARKRKRADEPDDYHEKERRYKTLACQTANSIRFGITCSASMIVGEVLAYFFRWGKERMKEVELEQSKALEKGRKLTGPNVCL